MMKQYFYLYSLHKLATADRSAMLNSLTAGPKNSTKTLSWLILSELCKLLVMLGSCFRISLLISSTTSVEVAYIGTFPINLIPITLGQGIVKGWSNITAWKVQTQYENTEFPSIVSALEYFPPHFSKSVHKIGNYLNISKFCDLGKVNVLEN